MDKIKKGKVSIYLQDDKYRGLAEVILQGDYKVIKVLKNDQRSRVKLIEYEQEKLVLKIPLEKNRRRWQRFLSAFRGSSSKREYENCLKILSEGFLGAKPVLVIDKKIGPFVKESCFVSNFIEGQEGNFQHLKEIGEELNKIHNAGYLHGDSQLVNFMVSNEEIYLIDCKLQKNIFGKFGSRYEFIYLEESCPKKIDIYRKDDLYYRGAKLLNSYLHWWGRTRKKLKGKELTK
ncbi:lipopolysaccharide core heptose(II) kinase RfaY [Ilyobacter polytropus]|uniref:Mn2+dependent serine/threonine protein kinase n=1 Tax=Ilyobacter polytropus (strain ATCC 51220 / DSM 2926 / LMG 16218 / CuHBu1) TaxID=572544 RepID=E3H740_ILYPC|nr:lipopolysaccharide core heptose(II) kinase RfaY [Ilyobacter polytropus]ADO81936.1 Mn2+dependent serine/threonine protein kinase [Ilyobacter polytropus DSM 2926]